jgi:hypothetical protein
MSASVPPNAPQTENAQVSGSPFGAEAVVEPIVVRARALERKLTRMGPLAANSAAGLTAALELLDRRDRPNRPFTIVLLGGTGVGKSRLFSALAEAPGASPSSDAERNHTRVPHVACALHERALTGIPDNSDPIWVDWERNSTVLVDTPDIDGMVLANRQVTKRILGLADLVVFVTSPDKLANAVPFEVLREWAPLTRWAFVLNKSDLVSNPAANASDWANRLLSIGFPGAKIHTTIASQQNDSGVSGLALALFAQRPPSRVRLLRHEAFLRVGQKALAAERIDGLDLGRAKLLARKGELAVGLHNALIKGLGQAETSESFRTILGDAVWQKLPAGAGPLLFLPLWAKARFFSLLTGYQFSRLALAGPTMIGAGLLGLSAAAGLYRNYGPLRRVVDNLGDSYRVALEQARNDARHTLEDMGLPQVESAIAHVPITENNDSPPWMRFIEDRIKSWALRGSDDGVLESLDNDIEKASGSLARGIWRSPSGMMSWTLGNVLPAIMLCWILYRAGTGWYDAKYPDTSFFLSSLLLWCVSFAPGFFWVWGLVWNRVHRIPVSGLIHQNSEPSALRPLTLAADELEETRREAVRLREGMVQNLNQLESGEASVWGTVQKG